MRYTLDSKPKHGVYFGDSIDVNSDAIPKSATSTGNRRA